MAVFQITVTMTGHFPSPGGAIWGHAARAELFTSPSEEVSRNSPELTSSIKSACASYGVEPDVVQRVYIGEVFQEEIRRWIEFARPRRMIAHDPYSRTRGVFLVVLQGPSSIGFSDIVVAGDNSLSLDDQLSMGIGYPAELGNKSKLSESHLEFIELSLEDLNEILPYARPSSELYAEMESYTRETGHLPFIDMHDWDMGAAWWDSDESTYRTCPKPEDFVSESVD